MTDNKGVAWLEGLAARGITATVRKGKLVLHPSKPNPYKRLTDAETLTLRHHKADIIAAVTAGISFAVTPTAEALTSTPAPEPVCKWCYRAPCIGVEHDAFYALHPVERERRDGERLTKDMLAAWARR